jgi:hypothetical protein
MKTSVDTPFEVCAAGDIEIGEAMLYRNEPYIRLGEQIEPGISPRGVPTAGRAAIRGDVASGLHFALLTTGAVLNLPHDTPVVPCEAEIHLKAVDRGATSPANGPRLVSGGSGAGGHPQAVR